MKSNFKPYNNYVSVNVINEEQMTQSGLTITSGDKQKMITNKGRVTGVGQNVVGVSEGNIIHYLKGRSFKMLDDDGKVFIMVRDVDVVAVE